ncbi:uncharacterized protein LOC122191337 [Lagopus leucura]|uniref:uncharacterized protein LOC122191337 n=1 Tax=Lagopus leucura TaxID=30410 RepID=UPI001C680D23|nr:uncharacterized protein LOC122191337 [Lagopus leucura]XP_042747531.1 uncharacterized protein LOC122191337 [Lagopus leucura]
MLSPCSQVFRAGQRHSLGCSAGGGSMARVWGAAAPTRLALLLLLVAMCFQETRAAPWRAPADDDADAPYPDDWVDTAFVPEGNPRGPLGELPERSPVAEPGLDARGPERWNETLRIGEYPQRLSHVLKKIMKEKAAHETDGEPEHRDAFQGGSRRMPHVPPGETEAKHTTGAPGKAPPRAPWPWSEVAALPSHSVPRDLGTLARGTTFSR